MVFNRDDPDEVRALKVDQGETEATKMDSSDSVAPGTAEGREGRDEVLSVLDVVDERDPQSRRICLVVFHRGEEFLAGGRRELDAQLAAESASGFGEDLLGRDCFHFAGF